MQNLRTPVIEDLVDSNFIPGEHEAYTYIMDRYPNLSQGRVGSLFQKELDKLDWNEIEKTIDAIKKD